MGTANKRIKSIILIAVLCCLGLVLFFKQSAEPEGTYVPIATNQNNGYAYAGSSTCVACHKDIYEQHKNTAHFNTSGLATNATVKGSFLKGENRFELNEYVTYHMVENEGKLFQNAYINGIERKSETFDVFVGSGTKGQTYLYWAEDKLFQLPVSYHIAVDGWINSPGYPNDKPLYNRPVLTRCLECHSTYFENKVPKDVWSNEFSKEKSIYGIDCESCHGPSHDHVEYHTEHPEELLGKNIKSWSKLSRKKQLDGCALCHSGRRVMKSAPFSFMPGDDLENFSTPDYSPGDIATLDVHGNQYGLLTASQCFINSDEMTCVTCHNPHKKERNDLKTFSLRCMGCHDDIVQTSGHMTEFGTETLDNCIDCHMPKMASNVLTFLTGKSDIPDSLKVRTHLIGIYDLAFAKEVAEIEEWIEGIDSNQ
ncbi:MAG: multiheme c-type cytochrome [Bacteroidota bacterium]